MRAVQQRRKVGIFGLKSQVGEVLQRYGILVVSAADHMYSQLCLKESMQLLPNSQNSHMVVAPALRGDRSPLISTEFQI